jgi:hypothetical protein
MKMKCSFGNGKCAYCDVAILRSFIKFFFYLLCLSILMSTRERLPPITFHIFYENTVFVEIIMTTRFYKQNHLKRSNTSFSSSYKFSDILFLFENITTGGNSTKISHLRGFAKTSLVCQKFYFNRSRSRLPKM